MSQRANSAALAIGIGLLATLPANAYDFVPTNREFTAWPQWCQELYVATDVGRQSPFVTRIRRELATKAYANPDLHGFWHYCAGMVWLDRARAVVDQSQATFKYEQAIAETSFNYGRSGPGHFLRGEMGTTLGLAYRGLGQYDKAKEFLRRAIEEEPHYAPAYTAMYLVHRDLGERAEARAVLLRGNDSTKNKSAELHYFLGLSYLDDDDLVSAKKHAEVAYRLGYPLPGLKNKLKRLDSTPASPSAPP